MTDKISTKTKFKLRDSDRVTTTVKVGTSIILRVSDVVLQLRIVSVDKDSAIIEFLGNE